MTKIEMAYIVEISFNKHMTSESVSDLGKVFELITEDLIQNGITPKNWVEVTPVIEEPNGQ